MRAETHCALTLRFSCKGAKVQLCDFQFTMPFSSGCSGICETKADELMRRLCRQTVNEGWRKRSSSVVVRAAERLITFGLAVALILMLCKIHSLSVSSLRCLFPLHSPLSCARSDTDACVHEDKSAHTSHMPLPLNTLTLPLPDAQRSNPSSNAVRHPRRDTHMTSCERTFSFFFFTPPPFFFFLGETGRQAWKK